MATRDPHRIVFWTLLLLPLAIAALKLGSGSVPIPALLPQTEHQVRLDMQLDGQGGDVRLSTYLPSSDGRQTINSEQISDAGLYRTVLADGLNRKVSWSGKQVRNDVQLQVSFAVLTKSIRYEIDKDALVPMSYPAAIAPFLRPEADVQVDDPEIVAELTNIQADQGPLFTRLERIYKRTSDLVQRPFKGTTDALTALRLGAASCNGKSRLFVALARQAGIPARLVGGYVMTSARKRTTHQWVEVYVGGHWLSFDPTNSHFARLPDNYLKLYTGDESMFRHSKDINFDYSYRTSTRLVPSRESKGVLGKFNVWSLFERTGLPLSLLRTLLMLPLGALIVVVFRNVIGLPTWGTFLPALIAAAASETGIFYGLLGMATVVLVVAGVRALVHRLDLLHSPTLAIGLAAVSATLLGITLMADLADLGQLTRVALFPIAVLAITAERFYLSLTENGTRDALIYLAGTSVVIVACYVVMSSLALQVIVIAFPEVLLVVVALNIYLGRWIGMRLSEYRRFRGLLRPQQA